MPLRRREGAAAGHQRPSCARTSSAAASSAALELPAAHRRRRPRARNVNYAEWRSRLADALVVGSVTPRPDGRFEARFRLLRRGEADAARRPRLHLRQGADARHRAPHRRLRLREAHRREGRVLHAHRLRGEARQPLRAADRRRRRRRARRPRSPRSSRSSRRPGRPTASASPTCRSRTRSRWSTCTRSPTASATWWRTSRAPTRRRPGRPTATRLAVVAVARGRLAALHRERRRQRRAAPRPARRGIDTEPRFSPDGQSIYFTSDRGGTPQIYRMPASGGEPQRVTFEGSYNVSPRISPDGKTLAYITRNDGQVPGRAARSVEPPGADPHRQRPRRIAQLRAQRPHDPARHRDRRTRRALGGVGRRAREAAPARAAAAMCASRPGDRSSNEERRSHACHHLYPLIACAAAAAVPAPPRRPTSRAAAPVDRSASRAPARRRRRAAAAGDARSRPAKRRRRSPSPRSRTRTTSCPSARSTSTSTSSTSRTSTARWSRRTPSSCATTRAPRC